MSPTQILWAGFAALIFLALAFDLGVFHRVAKAESFRRSLAWVLIWFTLAMLFDAGVWFHRGPDKALEFLTGYVIEISLSMDNVFVFVLIFSYFAVPTSYQHKILFWGILGALVLRGLMIGLGCALVMKFAWILYIFGAFLIFTGFKMAFKGAEEKIEPEKNPVVKLFRRFIPMTPDFCGAKFFVRDGGRLRATPICLVLALVEASDVVFAVDSVPAIFAITTDPFIVYTSNVFAILGLRSLYFVLARVVEKFHALHYGLGFVLVFVGVKMLAGHSRFEIGTLPSLAVVGVILAVSVIVSLLRPVRS
jgi:tellurite resistance protein TerC